MGRIVYTDPSGQEFSVALSAESPVVTIGRATDCTIRSNRKSVSRHHAEFRYSNGRFEVVDLVSANGTYLIINNERRPVHGRQFISHGDEIWCGDFILHFYEDQQMQQVAHDPYGAQMGRGPTGMQQPASVSQGFGVEANKYEYAEHEAAQRNTGFGAEFGDFHAQHEGDALSFAEYEELLEEDISEAQEGSSGELDRLRAEKRSIEELAAKQAFEVVELRIHLSERDQQIEQLRQSLDKLEGMQGDAARLKEVEARSEELERKLNEALSQIQQLEALPRTAEADPAELEELRNSVNAKERNISLLQRELDQAHVQLQNTTERAEQAEKSASSALEELRNATSKGTSEEIHALRSELERQGRLMTEFERRSRELQLELDHERDIVQSLRAKVSTHDALTEELALISRERDDAVVKSTRLQEEVAQAQSAADQAKSTIRDLKSEIQGLKRLLQMERERGREDGALAEVNAELQQKITALSQDLAELQSAYQQQESDLQAAREALATATLAASVSPEYFVDMRERIDTLDRIVDAIERTDLQPLTTVDRIRLQSAIRDGVPRTVLQEMRRMTIEILSTDDNS